MLKVLFLCTGNACRSQMAEGWAKALQKDLIEAYSAGIRPHGVDPKAIQVMGEAGVDISDHHSKDITELGNIRFDVIVTVCDRASEACPVVPGTVCLIHHSFEDPPTLARNLPDQEALQIYRRVRDEIRAFVETLPQVMKEVSI